MRCHDPTPLQTPGATDMEAAQYFGYVVLCVGVPYSLVLSILFLVRASTFPIRGRQTTLAGIFLRPPLHVVALLTVPTRVSVCVCACGVCVCVQW